MTKLRKTVSAALAVAVIAGSGLSVSTTSNAAPMIRAAAVETSSDVVKVGFHKHHNHHGWRRHGWRHYGGYYDGGCFFKKKKFYDDYYGWYYKKVRICY